MGIYEYLFGDISQQGAAVMARITRQPLPSSKPVHVHEPPPAKALPQEEQLTVYERAKGTISPVAMSIYRGASSISEQIRRGIPEVSRRVETVPVVGKPTAFITARTSESFARVIETGGMIPGGVEVLAKRPSLIPEAVRVGVTETAKGTISEIRTDPFQTATDIAVTGLIFKGVSRTPMVAKGIGRAFEAPKLRTFIRSEEAQVFRRRPAPAQVLIERPMAAQVKAVREIEFTGITAEGKLITRAVHQRPSPQFIRTQGAEYGKFETRFDVAQERLRKSVQAISQEERTQIIARIKQTGGLYEPVEVAKPKVIEVSKFPQIQRAKPISLLKYSPISIVKPISIQKESQAYKQVQRQGLVQKPSLISGQKSREKSIILPRVISPTVQRQPSITPQRLRPAQPMEISRQARKVAPITTTRMRFPKSRVFKPRTLKVFESGKFMKKGISGFGKFPEISRVASIKQIFKGL